MRAPSVRHPLDVHNNSHYSVLRKWSQNTRHEFLDIKMNLLKTKPKNINGHKKLR